MASSRIIQDKQTGNSVRVGYEGELNVVMHPHPPKNEIEFPLPYVQFFTDDGTITGSNDMRVDGSTTPVSFYVEALEDRDLFIKTITIQISDPGASLDKFGALTALTNGVKFSYQSVKTGEVIIEEAIQTNLDFFRDATGGKGFGSTNPWLVDIKGGTGEDTYLPELDFLERFGLQYGVKLFGGTTDRIVFQINDNLGTGLSVFNIKAYGITLSSIST